MGKGSSSQMVPAAKGEGDNIKRQKAKIMYSAHRAIERSGEMRKIMVLALCVFTPLSIFFLGVTGAEETSPAGPPKGEVAVEELEPEPLDDVFAIKLLEKIIELEDALKYLAKEVGEMNRRLTEKVDKMGERLTKLEKSPPAYTRKSETGKPYTPPPPPQTHFDVGDLYLGSGFKGHDIVYETTEKGTIFKGEIENDNTAEAEVAEFEVVVYDEKDKMLGVKGFVVQDIAMGEKMPFEALIKNTKAHWIKRYEIQYLRGS